MEPQASYNSESTSPSKTACYKFAHSSNASGQITCCWKQVPSEIGITDFTVGFNCQTARSTPALSRPPMRTLHVPWQTFSQTCRHGEWRTGNSHSSRPIAPIGRQRPSEGSPRAPRGVKGNGRRWTSRCKPDDEPCQSPPRFILLGCCAGPELNRTESGPDRIRQSTGIRTGSDSLPARSTPCQKVHRVRQSTRLPRQSTRAYAGSVVYAADQIEWV